MNMTYRTIACSIACVSLLLVLGCGGSPETPPPTPPAPESQDLNNQPPEPEETAPEATTPENPPQTPDLFTPSDTGESNPTTENGNKEKPVDENNPFAPGPSGTKPVDQTDKILPGISRERPKDVTEWEWSDIMPAIKEKDGLLKDALLFLAKKNSGNSKIVEDLASLLDPATLNPQKEENPPAEGNTATPGYNTFRQQQQQQMVNLDQQMVEHIIVALMLNKTPKAAKILRKIVTNKDLNIVHPQVATKKAIRVLAIMGVEQKQNDHVLFKTLVDPWEYRDPQASMSGGSSHNRGRIFAGGQGNDQRMSAETLGQEAEKILKPIASENLRSLLGGYILRDSIKAADRKKFRGWFTESAPENLLGQIRIYEANAPDPELLSQFESFFTLYSKTAIARLLGILPRTPDLATIGNTNKNGSSLQELKGWGSGGGTGQVQPGNQLEVAIAEYRYEQKKNTTAEEELVRLTKKLWGREIAGMVAKRLNERITRPTNSGIFAGGTGHGGTNEKNSIALAYTMPLDKVRNSLFKRCKNYYQQGPKVALGDVFTQSTNQTSMDPVMAAIKAQGAGGIGGNVLGQKNNTTLLAIDPGLLVTLKMLHREDPNVMPNNPRAGRTMSPAGGTGNVQHQWFYASQQLVAKLFSQCLTAAAPSAAAFGGPQTLAGESKEKEADPSRVDIHRNAQIVTRLDFMLPQGVQGSLKKLPMDPLEVHYIRIEEVNKPKTIAKHYRRVVNGQEHVLPGNMGWWFDAIKDGTKGGSKRSVDVVITPGTPKAVNPGGKPQKPRKGMYPLVVQILVVETANPTIEK
ncbi:MAG: hypothetical protein PVH19_13150 [Planctomycetia bacterium]|jgi:hypothetical protein